MLKYEAGPDDPEAVEVFKNARAGDAAAVERVHALIRERKWSTWLGDMGRQATLQLIARLAGGDPVFRAGLTQKAEEVRAELLAEHSTILEALLVRRVVNGWLHTHALELELTLRPPLDPKAREYLDRALSRAQKRMRPSALNRCSHS
jgi:hypothetical protein